MEEKGRGQGIEEDTRVELGKKERGEREWSDTEGEEERG